VCANNIYWSTRKNEKMHVDEEAEHSQRRDTKMGWEEKTNEYVVDILRCKRQCPLPRGPGKVNSIGVFSIDMTTIEKMRQHGKEAARSSTTDDKKSGWEEKMNEYVAKVLQHGRPGKVNSTGVFDIRNSKGMFKFYISWDGALQRKEPLQLVNENDDQMKKKLHQYFCGVQYYAAREGAEAEAILRPLVEDDNDDAAGSAIKALALILLSCIAIGKFRSAKSDMERREEAWDAVTELVKFKDSHTFDRLVEARIFDVIGQFSRLLSRGYADLTKKMMEYARETEEVPENMPIRQINHLLVGGTNEAECQELIKLYEREDPPLNSYLRLSVLSAIVEYKTNRMWDNHMSKPLLEVCDQVYDLEEWRETLKKDMDEEKKNARPVQLALDRCEVALDLWHPHKWIILEPTLVNHNGHSMMMYPYPPLIDESTYSLAFSQHPIKSIQASGINGDVFIGVRTLEYHGRGKSVWGVSIDSEGTIGIHRFEHLNDLVHQIPKYQKHLNAEELGPDDDSNDLSDLRVKYELGDTLIMKHCGGKLNVSIRRENYRAHVQSIRVADKVKMGIEEPLSAVVFMHSVGAGVRMLLLQGLGKSRVKNGNRHQRGKMNSNQSSWLTRSTYSWEESGDESDLSPVWTRRSTISELQRQKPEKLSPEIHQEEWNKCIDTDKNIIVQQLDNENENFKGNHEQRQDKDYRLIREPTKVNCGGFFANTTKMFHLYMHWDAAVRRRELIPPSKGLHHEGGVEDQLLHYFNGIQAYASYHDMKTAQECFRSLCPSDDNSRVSGSISALALVMLAYLSITEFRRSVLRRRRRANSGLHEECQKQKECEQMEQDARYAVQDLIQFKDQHDFDPLIDARIFDALGQFHGLVADLHGHVSGTEAINAKEMMAKARALETVPEFTLVRHINYLLVACRTKEDEESTKQELCDIYENNPATGGGKYELNNIFHRVSVLRSILDYESRNNKTVEKWQHELKNALKEHIIIAELVLNEYRSITTLYAATSTEATEAEWNKDRDANVVQKCSEVVESGCDGEQSEQAKEGREAGNEAHDYATNCFSLIPTKDIYENHDRYSFFDTHSSPRDKDNVLRRYDESAPHEADEKGKRNNDRKESKFTNGEEYNNSTSGDKVTSWLRDQCVNIETILEAYKHGKHRFWERLAQKMKTNDESQNEVILINDSIFTPHRGPTCIQSVLEMELEETCPLRDGTRDEIPLLSQLAHDFHELRLDHCIALPESLDYLSQTLEVTKVVDNHDRLPTFHRTHTVEEAMSGKACSVRLQQAMQHLIDRVLLPSPSSLAKNIKNACKRRYVVKDEEGKNKEGSTVESIVATVSRWMYSGWKLVLDFVHIPIAQKTILEEMKEGLRGKNADLLIPNPIMRAQWEERYINATVRTIYNNRIYKVKRIDFDKTPMSTFLRNDRSTGRTWQCSFEAYVNEVYGVGTITERRQPMFEVENSKEERWTLGIEGFKGYAWLTESEGSVFKKIRNFKYVNSGTKKSFSLSSGSMCFKDLRERLQEDIKQRYGYDRGLEKERYAFGEDGARALFYFSQSHKVRQHGAGIIYRGRNSLTSLTRHARRGGKQYDSMINMNSFGARRDSLMGEPEWRDVNGKGSMPAVKDLAHIMDANWMTLCHGFTIVNRNQVVEALNVIVPCSKQGNLGYGCRHNAAIELTQKVDSMVVIFSSEGPISLIRNGVVHRMPEKSCTNERSFIDFLCAGGQLSNVLGLINQEACVPEFARRGVTAHSFLSLDQSFIHQLPLHWEVKKNIIHLIEKLNSPKTGIDPGSCPWKERMFITPETLRYIGFDKSDPTSQISPEQRYDNALRLRARLEETLKDVWGLRIVENASGVITSGGDEINSKKSMICTFDPVEVTFGKSTIFKVSDGMFPLKSIQNKLQTPVRVDNFLFLFPKADTARVNAWFKPFREIASVKFGVKISDPRRRCAVGENWEKEFPKIIRAHCTPDIQLILVILPSEGATKIYRMIKRETCVNYPVVSQVIRSETLKCRVNVPSILSHIILGINAKLAGVLWNVNLTRVKPFFDVATMVIGLDLRTSEVEKTSDDDGLDYDGKMESRSYLAGVATMDRFGADAFSSCFDLGFKTPPHCSSDSSSSTTKRLRESVKTFVESSLEEFFARNECLPVSVVVYRGSTLPSSRGPDEEVGGIRRIIRGFRPKYQPKVTFISVNRTDNIRFFSQSPSASSKMGNPPAGTVVDGEYWASPESHHGACSGSQPSAGHKPYDFCLAHHANSTVKGTICPSHFTVLFDEMRAPQSTVQELTYLLCYLYFNFCGASRYPSVLMYAQKLAKLCAEIKAVPSPRLRNTPYFL